MISLEIALQTVVAVLNERKILYAVMGGLAVRVYAIPRFTNDVDLTISIDRQELPLLFDAFRAVGIEIPPPFRAGWLDSVAGLPLFKADLFQDERSIEIDIFVSETEFQHSLILRRKKIETPAGEIWFVTPEDLILLKLIASRPRDLIDVQDILFTLGQLDVQYMEYWAKELSIVEALRKALNRFSNENGDET